MSNTPLLPDYFLFDFQHPWPKVGRSRSLVVYAATNHPRGRFILEAIERYNRESIPADRILLIGTSLASEPLLAIANEPANSRHLRALTRHAAPPSLLAGTFDSRGRLTISGLAPADPLELLTDQLVRAGLLTIFTQRDAVLHAPSGSHFINPSGRHTPQFIRAGNLLLYGAEVAFIAFTLLRSMPFTVGRLLTDSASINSLAYATVELRRSLDDSFRRPTIDSFSSYPGLERILAHHVRDPWILISASTSGDLETKIHTKHHIGYERMTTLVYCGPLLEGRQIVCDVTKRGNDSDGPLKHPISFGKDQQCGYCAHGSIPIRIVGDQFLTAATDVGDHLIAASNAPPLLGPLMKELVSRDTVKCHYGESGASGRTREIYLDLTPLLPDAQASITDRPPTTFVVDLERALSILVPASLTRIVYMGTRASQRLALHAAAYYHKSTGRPFPREAITADDVLLRDLKEGDLERHQSVLVVADTVVSGRSILRVSQALRKLHKGGIAYLVGIVRMASRTEWDDLRSNLSYGRRPREFPVINLRAIDLPPDSGSRRSPWADEATFLDRRADSLLASIRTRPPAFQAAAQAAISARKQVLESCSSRGGLRDDLFLPGPVAGSAAGEELHLTPGFVFWETFNESAVGSQAEVYMTISAILHRLRTPSPSEPPLLMNHEYHRTVLSPINFYRYNDGCIQASILRAALPSELDYRHDDSFSALMRGVIETALTSANQPGGSAVGEFLLALAMGRVKLAPRHAALLADTLGGHDELPPMLGALAAFVQSHGGTVSEH